MKKIAIILVLSLLGIELVGCTNSDVGTLSGGAIGGLVGSRFGRGDGRVVATAGGALIGAFIGNRIGQTMDKVDRQEMNRALETAPAGRSVSWQNPDTGNEYNVKPTRTYYEGSQPCREYTTTAIIGGKHQKIYGRACRTADGSWKVVE